MSSFSTGMILGSFPLQENVPFPNFSSSNLIKRQKLSLDDVLNATSNKMATIIQKHIRGYLVRGPFLPRNLTYQAYQALCEKAEGPESNSMPQAPGGKTIVYLPLEMPEVALKLLGKDSAIKRFHQMREVRSFLNSQQSSHLIIPRAKLCGKFLVEQRLPVNVDFGHNMMLYTLQPKLFDDAVREFVRLFSKRHISVLTILYGERWIRYDNIPLYIIERDGKKEGCIGFIDLERIQNSPDPQGLNDLVKIFPFHLDLIKEEANFLNMKVHDRLLEDAKCGGIRRLVKAGVNSWGERFYSSLNSDFWEEMLSIDLTLLGNPSQKEIDKILSYASEVSDYDPGYAIYIYKQVIAQNPRSFEAYKALCTLLEDQVDRLSIFSKAAAYAAEDGNHELAMHFRRHSQKLMYQTICQEDLGQLSEGESPVYPTAMSEEDWANPAAFLKKLPPMPRALVDFLEGPCPIHEGKQAKETHFVVPLTKNFTKGVEGNLVTLPRTIGNLHDLSIATKGPRCVNYWDLGEKDKPSEIEFEWAVMTREVFPNSKGEDYDVQKQMVEEKGYQMPGILEAATCILFEHRRSGIYLYNFMTYTRCHESFHKDFYAAVGNFSKRGLFVNSCFDSGGVGVAGIRKFKP